MKKSCVMLWCLVHVFALYVVGNEFEHVKKRRKTTSAKMLQEENAQSCANNISCAAEIIGSLALLQKALKNDLEETVKDPSREYQEAQAARLAKITNQLCEIQISLGKCKNSLSA